MNQLFELLDNHLEQEKQIFDFLQQDKNNMMDFLKLVVQTPNDIHNKYPFIVSELVYGSYDQLLQMMFDWNAEPIQYLLTFFNYPQNETTCGYFEKMIKPLILLKSAEIIPFLDVSKWIQYTELESIQNVFISIFACNNLDHSFKKNLFDLFFQQTPIIDDMYRVLLNDTDQFLDYLKNNQHIVDIVCAQQPLTYNQLSMIEYFFKQNLLNVMWLCSQIKVLQNLVIVEFDKQIQNMNFLYKPQGLNEVHLKLIQIVSQSIDRPETIEFQNIMLELLIKYEWNNSLQNIAVKMYEEMAKGNSQHRQYFLTIVSDFIQSKVQFLQLNYGLKTKIAPGYRWVFTKIVKLFDLNFYTAQEINITEAKYLLNEDPSENRERQSFNILEKVSERRNQWAKRYQEEEALQQEDNQNKQMEIEEEPNEEIMQGYRPRSSFGFKLPQVENEEEDEKAETDNPQFQQDN